MKKSVLILAACVLVLVLVQPGFLQGQFTIRMDVAMVSLDVGVSDSAGRPVTNLTRDDFLVYEDGLRQNLVNFASADSPYDLVLLSDCSDSTTREWPLLNEAIAGFSRFRKPQDRMLIAAFGSHVQITRNWNSRRENKLDRIWVCGGTRFYEAMNWGIQKLNGVKGRKSVVMLTDGVDNSIPTRMVNIGGYNMALFGDSRSDRDFQKSLRSVRRSGIPFYFVALGTDRNPNVEIPPHMLNIAMPNLREIRSRIEQLAEASGGDVVFPTKPEDVIPMYEQIGRDLGTAYSLGYAAPNTKLDGKRHKIEVRLKPQNLKLKQSRDAYTAN